LQESNNFRFVPQGNGARALDVRVHSKDTGVNEDEGVKGR
jgi:hypothetical protein